jgi:hypothetical protein
MGSSTQERLSDGRLRLHLVNGLTLPVSRTYASAVREAGLIPSNPPSSPRSEPPNHHLKTEY